MSNFTVRHVQPLEFPQVAELIAQNFPNEDPRLTEGQIHRWITHIIRQPGFQYDLHRVGLVDGKVVAHALVKPFTLRYGTVNLRVGGVSVLCTHPDYRRRGYATLVMRDALAYLAERGAHLALLNGIHHYYHRFGFSSVWPDYFFSVNSAEAAHLERPLRIRPAKARDIGAMADLYDHHWGGRIAFSRSRELWEWRVKEEAKPYMRVVDNERGQVCGYIAGDSPIHEEIEVVADAPEAVMTLLADAGRLCANAGLEKIQWSLPPDDAIVFFARQMLTVTLSARYPHSGGWMARIINTSALVEMILPEIVAQAEMVLPGFDARRLILNCLPDVVHIGLQGMPSADCRIHYRDFIQLLFGSLRPGELAARSADPLHADSIRLLEAIFPPRIAAIAPWDWF
jgi:predicted N-acetyltransferase YhbS